jgi:hypothetical protein
MDQGHVAEAGNHVELLARGGLYANLYEMQFKAQETTSPEEDSLEWSMREAVPAG